MIGFDDIPEAAFFRPPLSTIKQDFATLASSSVKCLMSQLNQNETGRLQTIQPTLVGRRARHGWGNGAEGKRVGGSARGGSAAGFGSITRTRTI